MPLTLYLGSAISVDTSGVMKVDSKVTLPNAPISETDAANKKYVDDRITSLIDSSPSQLDTLREIVEAYQSADNSFNNMLSQLATNSSNAISTETSRATSAELSLTTALSSETSRAESVETVLSSALSSETSRAESVETVLSSALSSETSRATSAELSLTIALSIDISTELSRAQSSELDLKTKLNETIARLNTVVTNFYKTHYTPVAPL
jgi:hypothetical protein